MMNFEPTSRNIQFIQLLCFFTAVYSIAIPSEWYWYALSIIVYGINVSVGLSFTMHRLYSHKCFTSFPLLEKVLSIHACMSMVGSPLSYSYIHRFHHANSDNEVDPHSPKDGIMHSIFGLHQPHKLHAFLIRDFLKDKFQMFIHKYYLLIVAAVCCIVGLYSLRLLVFGLLVPGFVTALASRLNNWVTHESRFGTQDNDTGDNSRNVWWWNILLFCSGEGWANNHHYRSGDYDFGRPQRRVDLVARLIEIMAKIGIVKVK